MNLPKPFTSDSIQCALAKHFQQQVLVKELHVQPNEAGGNYSSDIYRVKVKFTLANDEDQLRELQLLLKDLFENLAENSREHFMYQTVLPEMNNVLKGINEYAAFSPQVFMAHKAGGEQHLFEDLNAHGYIICDRLLGFNEAQTRCVLRKLGQFHATSMLYQTKHPAIVAGMKEFFCKSDANFMIFVQRLINDNTAHVAAIVEKWPNFGTIAQKMRANTGDKFKHKFLSILEKADCKVTVIAHGDLWIKNILMLEDADKVPQDAVFLDYQNCFQGSPGLDINNLLMTSVQLEAMNSTEKRYALFKHYHESLVETLLSCGFKSAQIPTLDKIMEEIERTEYISYYDLIFAFPQTNLSEALAKDMSFADFFDDERMARNRQDMFENPRVLATYKCMLPRFNEIGLLD